MPSPSGGGILFFRASHRAQKWNRVNLPFTVFVDAIFTTLLEALFTNASDVMARFEARACVWRAGRCD